MDIHCVVTGQTKSGKSVIVRDTPVQPISLALLPGYEFHRLWGSDSIQTLPCDGTAPPHPRYFPPTNGFRFGFFTIPPDARTRLDQIGTASALDEIQQKLPGMIDVLELDHPGMHTTNTVDFDVIVSGEVHLELDDGVEVLLKAGDCVIQPNTVQNAVRSWGPKRSSPSNERYRLIWSTGIHFVYGAANQRATVVVTLSLFGQLIILRVGA